MKQLKLKPRLHHILRKLLNHHPDRLLSTKIPIGRAVASPWRHRLSIPSGGELARFALTPWVREVELDVEDAFAFAEVVAAPVGEAADAEVPVFGGVVCDLEGVVGGDCLAGCEGEEGREGEGEEGEGLHAGRYLMEIGKLRRRCCRV